MPVYDVNGNKIAGNSEAEEAAKALGLHLMPKSIGEVNMVRRARQFTDIEWTPAVNIKRRNVVEYDQPLTWSQGWQDTFLAGVKYKAYYSVTGIDAPANIHFIQNNIQFIVSLKLGKKKSTAYL